VTRLHQVRLFALAVSLFFMTGGATGADGNLEPQKASAGKPALYYFVIDRSGSIKTNHLVVPIRGALIQKLGEVPENAEIRIVLFDRTAARRGTWGPITTNARGEISVWFDRNFRPQGDTRLYDTVGEALSEITESRGRFSMVQLVILSDGVEEPPVSTRFRRWGDLNSLSAELKRSEPPFFGTWYTLGFDPPDRPDANSGIDFVAVPDPQAGFKIIAALHADFDWAPSIAHANDPFTLIDTSQGLPERWKWDLPGGVSETKPRPEVLLKDPGDHSVTLTVSRGSTSDSITKTIKVAPALAKADFTLSSSSGTAPFEVKFEDASRGDIVAYAWDFGDGARSDLRSPTHVYSQSGSFTPRLTITHSKGGTAKSAGDIAIAVRAPMPAWIKWLGVVIAAALAWVGLVVPLVLKPIVLPHQGVALKGLQTFFLRQLCRKHRFGWLWPRGDVSIGSRATDFIRVGTGGKTVGVIRRRPGTSNYVLDPLDASSFRAMIAIPRDVMGVASRSVTAVIASVPLRNGDAFEIQGSSFVWVQPARKAPGKRLR
jgi:hypothetical protein